MESTIKKRNVECASRAKNPIELSKDFISYNNSREGARYTFYCRCKNDMDAKILKWAFKLAERNVGHFYKELSMGWQPKIKQRDLNKTWARYLVAQDCENKPVAYAMFRFDMDYGYSVLYCYEMQIEPKFHRQGLGRYMITILEQCANMWKMDKIVLTVLKNNVNAHKFFHAVGFTLDSSSPDSTEMVDYEILSKSTKV